MPSSKKKSTPARRGGKTPASKPEQRGSGRELFGLLFLCLGVLAIVFAFSPSGSLAADILYGVAGKLCFALPIVLIWLGLVIAFSGARKPHAGRVLLIALLAAILFAFVHLIDIERGLDRLPVRDYLTYVKLCYRDTLGAGAVGALVAYPLHLLLGRVGGMVVLLFLALGDLVLLRVISLTKVGTKAREYVEAGSRSIQAHRETRETRRAERQLEREQARAEAAKVLYVEKIAPVTQAEQAVERSDEVRPRPVPRVREPKDAESFVPVKPSRKKPAAMGDTRTPEPGKDAYRSAGITDVRVSGPNKDAYRSAGIGDVRVSEPNEVAHRSAGITDVRVSEPVADAYQPVDLFAASPAAKAAEPAEAKIPDAEPPSEDMYFEEVDPFAAPVAPPEPEASAEPEEPEDFPEERNEDDAYDAFDDASEDLIERKPLFEAPRRRAREDVPEMPASQPKQEERIDGAPLVMPKKQPRPEEQDMGEYNYPPVDLLAPVKPSETRFITQRDHEKAQKLDETLASFGISAPLVGIAHGPAVTRFEIAPAPGVKISRITALADDIALSLAAVNIRIEAPIPGKAAVGVEVPNDEVEIVPLREVLESSEARRHPSRLAVALGKDNGGRYIIADLAKMPHLLIAGATGSGKSACINDFICSILYRASPEEVRLIMIDPKVVELSVYNGIPHLLIPVVTDPKKAAGALAWAVVEMTNRYQKFAERGVRDMKGYNLACGAEDRPMPQIVVIIDELADLMMVAPGEVEDSICRLAQLARAAGIHLVIATQRPSVNVITGIIKANIPSRIAFTVASQVDSRTIIDVGGAEKLLGRGDMLFAPAGSSKPQRVQGAWVSDSEVNAIVAYIKERHDAEYDAALIDHINSSGEEEEKEQEEQSEDYDELLPQAIEMSVESGQASISMLQRRLRVGYARAGRLIDEMAARGIVSQSEGAKPRNVLITREQYKLLYEDQKL